MRLLIPTALLAFSLSCGSNQEVNANSTSAGTPPDSATPETVEAAASTGPNAAGAGLYGLAATSLEGEAVDLSAFEGQVTLVVNVASKCGYTRQYAGLQDLHAELEGPDRDPVARFASRRSRRGSARGRWPRGTGLPGVPRTRRVEAHGLPSTCPFPKNRIEDRTGSGRA